MVAVREESSVALKRVFFWTLVSAASDDFCAYNRPELGWGPSWKVSRLGRLPVSEIAEGDGGHPSSAEILGTPRWQLCPINSDDDGFGLKEIARPERERAASWNKED